LDGAASRGEIMAVKPCKECGKEVSSKAKSCPHCGAPTKRRLGVLRGLVVVFLGVVGVGYCATLVDSPTGLPTCDASETETAVRDAIENSVEARLVNQRLLAMENQAEVSFDEAKPERKCKATAFLNSGEVKIRYRLFKTNPTDATFLVYVNED
jgi:hypothetical protein